MYVQLKKLTASKCSSSLCDGYVAVSNLNTKVWGFCFSSSCFLSLFVWLSECSCGQTGLFFPKWSQMHQRCQSLRVLQPWENNIYGNGKSIKHLCHCSPCSVVFMFKKRFLSPQDEKMYKVPYFLKKKILYLSLRFRNRKSQYIYKN